MAAARVLSLQVGRPRLVPDALGGPPFRSGICKEPVAGPLPLGAAGLPGDGVASRRYHGGPDKALLVYAAEHYPRWREALRQPELAFGAFGENLTTEGLTEASVCLGDRYRVGGAIIEVTEPRGPCSKLARRLGVADLVAQVKATGQSGWYCRVCEAGEVAAGAAVALLSRPFPAWSVLRAGRVIAERDRAGAAELLQLPGLAAALKPALSKVIRGPR